MIPFIMIRGMAEEGITTTAATGLFPYPSLSGILPIIITRRYGIIIRLPIICRYIIILCTSGLIPGRITATITAGTADAGITVIPIMTVTTTATGRGRRNIRQRATVRLHRQPCTAAGQGIVPQSGRIITESVRGVLLPAPGDARHNAIPRHPARKSMVRMPRAEMREPSAGRHLTTGMSLHQPVLPHRRGCPGVTACRLLPPPAARAQRRPAVLPVSQPAGARCRLLQPAAALPLM